MDKDDFLKGMLVGAVVGSLVGMLFAPKAGEEIRRGLGEKAEKIKRQARQKAYEFDEEIGPKYEQVKEMFEKSRSLDPKKRKVIEEEFRNFIDRIEEISEED